MSGALCPQGHLSDTTDYCDQCGAKIDGAPAGAAAPEPAASVPAAGPAATVSAPAVPAGPIKDCPSCHTPNAVDDRFCESCGYDFTAGAAPAAAAAPGPGQTAAWEAVVVADRTYYERMEVDDIAFPAVCPDRHFSLTGDRFVIGRRSVSRGVNPEIDLSGAPEDVGVSHTHAVLVAGPDGAWTIIDPGSANGTVLNDATDPIPTNQAVPLNDGDRLHIGAWTTVTLRKTTA